jgi:hypothetical protein
MWKKEKENKSFQTSTKPSSTPLRRGVLSSESETAYIIARGGTVVLNWFGWNLPPHATR